MRLRSLLQSFDCMQHVYEPTHNDGHVLDLIITKTNTKLSHVHVGDLLSDHALVTFLLDVKKPRLERLWTTCRPWKTFSQSAFEADLRASQLCTDVDALQDLSADELAKLYDTTLQMLLDKHCPAVQTQRKFGRLTPWYDADCRASRRKSRALERRYKRTGADVDRRAWIKQLKTTHGLHKEKNHQHWRAKIADSKGNMKKLWQTTSGITGEKPGGRCEDGECTAEDFAQFFSDKVDSIRSSTSTTPLCDISDTASHAINEWTPVTALEVQK